FGGLRTGMGALADAVLAAVLAAGGELRTGLPVRELRRTPEGFRLVAGPVPAPTALDCDGVVVAVPAPKAAPLLRGVAPSAAGELAGIDYASMAIVTLVYPEGDLPPGSGVLVPTSERRTVKALTFASQKWAHLAGHGHVVRASIGRYGEEHTLQHDDTELVAAAVSDIAALTGLASAPVASRVTRWGGALPQYAVGHLDRVRRIRASVAGVAGLAVCGAAYDGVGIPACIRSGQTAARTVLAGLEESKP
ncbi:MAG: protoporphyrinogen oxidase, partial [Micromonosporaceae bacterium]